MSKKASTVSEKLPQCLFVLNGWERNISLTFGEQLLFREPHVRTQIPGLPQPEPRDSPAIPNSAIHLWGRSGKGHCRKKSLNFLKLFLGISALYPDAISRIFANFCKISAEVWQNFLQTPFTNHPISELLNDRKRCHASSFCPGYPRVGVRDIRRLGPGCPKKILPENFARRLYRALQNCYIYIYNSNILVGICNCVCNRNEF